MNTPILFIIFNRPETTGIVFNEIKKIKPKDLFIFADGPRDDKKDEDARCQETREITEKIDWNCNIHRKYSEKNLGCKIGVSSAINWFFNNVDEGIILEDDCLPNKSFFNFCEELLNKYRNNDNIFIISGTNFLKPENNFDYYFTKIPHIWGWATWKRTWELYDLEMKDFDNFKKNKTIKKIWNKIKYQIYWLEILEEVYNNRINTWDYQLTYACWKNKKINISPNKNLISNIGFGSEATHTKNISDIKANLVTENLIFPIKHPSIIKINEIMDNNVMDSLLINRKFFILKYIIKKIFKKIHIFNLIKKIKNANS